MCIAELNVSLLPCQHRWYHLARPCSDTTNLSNCGAKLGLSGWEIKCDFCPYCADWNVSNTDYRLLGNDKLPSVGGLSRTPSLPFSLSATRRDSRRGSLARSDSSTSITMMAQEKNRAMSARVDSYFGRFPAPVEAPVPMESREEHDVEAMLPSSSNSDTSSDGHDSLPHDAPTPIRAKHGFLYKVRHKSKRLSTSLFK
ncbi:hypothetical protein GQ43DRAFT_467685 [Delitschia confertaspora ATCC 74209]|uniref:Uncharacterized protein n=1 Tax=Delitschia confertaspora ATCC 74209 TaxID=1513339 RepID=A0A9P4JVR8_9PLEO|nr:hypothetical protein GQ43DRAFT_467685 [Delitschia confertaspora ATCC 74209]